MVHRATLPQPSAIILTSEYAREHPRRVEDAFASWLPAQAQALGWVAAALVVWRLGLSGLRRVATQAPRPAHRHEGWLALPPVGGVTVLAWLHGLPFHGWLP